MPSHAPECSIRQGDSCDCARPSYSDLLYEAAEKIRYAGDWHSNRVSIAAQKRIRVSLISEAIDALREASERL